MAGSELRDWRRPVLLWLVLAMVASGLTMAAGSTTVGAAEPTLYEVPSYPNPAPLYQIGGVTDEGSLIGSKYIDGAFRMAEWHPVDGVKVLHDQRGLSSVRAFSNGAAWAPAYPRTFGRTAGGQTGGFDIPPGRTAGGPTWVSREMKGVGNAYTGGAFIAYQWDGLDSMPRVVHGIDSPIAINGAGQIVYTTGMRGEARLHPSGTSYGRNLGAHQIIHFADDASIVARDGMTGAILRPGGSTTSLPFGPTTVNADGVIAGDASVVQADFTVLATARVRTPDGLTHDLFDMVPSKRLADGTTIVGFETIVGMSDNCHFTGRARAMRPGGSSHTYIQYVAQVPDCEGQALEGDITFAAPNPNRLIPAGETTRLRARVQNVSSSAVTGLTMVGDGVVTATDGVGEISMVLPDQPRFLPNLAGGAEATFDFDVTAEGSGEVGFAFDVVASTPAGGTVDATIKGSFRVGEVPDVSVVVTSSVTNETKVGDTIEIRATVTNNEDEKVIADVSTDRLNIDDPDLLRPISGPLNANGNDPRVDALTIGPGESTFIKWEYEALHKGTFTAETAVSYRDRSNGALYFKSGSVTVAIEAPGLALDQLRISPGDPVPGAFGNIRGRITNIGHTDVTDIDFEVTSAPDMDVVESVLEDFPESANPRKSRLEPNETAEFVIPFQLTQDVGELATFTTDVTFSGIADLDGEEVTVEITQPAVATIDRNDYWVEILPEVGRLLLQGLFDLVDDIDAVGDEGGLVGGASVGTAQAALNVLQKMGDGILKATDLLGEASGDGGERLTNDAKAIFSGLREYYHTHTVKQMASDLGNVPMEGIDSFAKWMFTMEKAYEAGDHRTVAKMLAEPGLTLASGVGFEAAGAKILSGLWNSKALRGILDAKKRAPDSPDGPDGDVPHERKYAQDSEDLADLPEGVPLTGVTVARFGINPDEHAWMIEMARKFNVSFFVRPRPQPGAKWAQLGYNAKPMAIKLKSVSDIDVEWLGYDDFKGKEGLVVFREPKKPYDKLREAVDSGKLKWDDPVIKDVLERYNKKKAEWESFGGAEGFVEKMNSKTPGLGFQVQRYGKTIWTKVSVDGDGLVRFTHNGQPVFSDIDLMQIGRPNGELIPEHLHRRLAREGGFGLDSQHGDSAASSDFPNERVARDVSETYIKEHMRGGDPLLIVGQDASTKGWVEGYTIDDTKTGSGYDLYGMFNVTYTGAGI